MKKTIGISFTTTNLKYYWSWFANDLHEVDLIDLSYQRNNLRDFEKCDGFILTGGVDIHPSLYKCPEDYENRPPHFQVERDLFEEKLFWYSQEKKKPLLGLCRGMQLVNVLQGGKLIRDLGVENELHASENGVDKEHPIAIEAGSLLSDISKVKSGVVNSAHHQVVDPSAIGENLRVNAFSGVGKDIIEGIEFMDKTDKGFMLCVQWHPERMRDRDNPLCKNIRSSFLKAVKNEN